MLFRFRKVMRRHPWTGGIGASLLLAVLVTAGVRWMAVQNVWDNTEERRKAVVADAFSVIEQQFGALRKQVRGRARALATDSVVVQGLATWNERKTRSPALVRHVLDAPIDERTTVEVYTPLPRVLAWNGRPLPFGDAPDEEAFLQRPQTAVVPDGTVRHALVTWWPVRREGQVLGAVRVARTIQYRPPVKNRYIQGFGLQDEWERATGESVRVTWARPTTEPTHPYRLLRDARGAVLGHVIVSSPSPTRLVQRVVTFYDDLLAGWAVLFLAWVGWIAGQWYLRLARRPGVRRHAGARAAATGRFAGLVGLWVGARYLLLGLDVPGRWLEHVGTFAPLFDPTRFASTIGGGVFRSIGDLFLTGLWIVVLAAGALHLALLYRRSVASVGVLLERIQTPEPSRPSILRFFGIVIGGVGLGLGSILALAYVIRRAVLDSTLDFFSRTGLLPEPLTFVVLCALLLLVVALVIGGVAGIWIGGRLLVRYRPLWPQGVVPAIVIMIVGGGVAALYGWTEAATLVPFPYPLIALGVVGGAAVYGLVGRNRGADVVTIRGLLLALFVVTLLFYPLLYRGMDAQRRERMVEAAQSFEEGYDPRALYSIRQVLRAAEEDIAPLFQTTDSLGAVPVDSVAPRLVRQSLLASLTTYDVSLTLFDAEGTLQRRYDASGRQFVRARSSRAEQAAFEALRGTYNRKLSSGPVLDRFGDDRRGRQAGPFAYAGLLWVDGQETGTWVLVRAEPRILLPGTGSGVPRVLLPDGSFSDLYAELSLAAFREGRIVRRFGPHFGRTRLSASHETALREQSTLWRTEQVQGQPYLTYYAHPTAEEADATIAVRIPALLAFDHLYYLLRLTVVGLSVGVVVYLLGLYGRYRHGVVPAQRVRFRDKVLNAFLIVGIVSMVAVGVVGVRVVTGEGERLVERRLRDRLARVEEMLALEEREGEPLWQVAQRISVDSLSARVGLDLRLYEDGQLVGTSRPRLVRDGLVDERLPGRVYHELYDNAYRFAVAEASIGTFRYRVGYQTLVDEAGQPRLVVGVPTLAQQEQVAEEQARTLAYLFGALLVLVVVVMLTAVVLASALTQPIARLREGLEAVGEGRFAESLPVNTRDEIGDLVRTFNEMRSQLAESRRKLAQQERESAWREMARQVAHEIKNPLTPMKLSIQHLRRAFKGERADTDEESAFAELFDRITTTLIEQIEALVRIANEFSTFARLPTRVLEPLDLNEVIREAVRLMERETEETVIVLDLNDEPLPVEADREELRRIYINLLKNALQAVADEPEGRVRVVTSAGGEEETGKPMTDSWVIDNGTGIPPDLQDKIFEPNFSTKTGGTGLGLAIAQKSIDELGGHIEYETEEGEGTTFRIRLPLVEEANSR